MTEKMTSADQARIDQRREDNTKALTAVTSQTLAHTAIGAAFAGPVGAAVGFAGTAAPFAASRVVENRVFKRAGITDGIYQMFLGKGLAERVSKYVEARKGDIDSEPFAKSINRFFEIVEKGSHVFFRGTGFAGGIGYLGANRVINSGKNVQTPEVPRAMKSSNIGRHDTQETNVNISPAQALDQVNNDLQGALEQ